MIIGVRMAVLCERADVNRETGEVTLVNVLPYELKTATRPGMLRGALALQLELDLTATRATVKLAAGDFKLARVIDIPATGRTVTVDLPLDVPVMEAVPLVVTITDARRRSRPWRYRWALDFWPDADVIDISKDELSAACRETSCAQVLAGSGAPALH